MATKPNQLKLIRQRRYLAKDFDGLRANLLEYARVYYPDKIKDFSDSSTGGVFLDFASIVGDNLSFYLDHQFGELDPETAIESTNIERALRKAGVPITGASPATVYETVYVLIPAETVSGVTGPMTAALPVVGEGTIFQSDNGTSFVLSEDIDFTATDDSGALKARVKIQDINSDGTPKNYILAQDGLVVSGKEVSETFSIGTAFVPFRTITLANANVTDVLSVVDGLGNVYYQVAALSHDVVYRSVLNTTRDNDLVPDALKPVPAPYRFTTSVDLATRSTTLTFGAGPASSLDDDVIPDPADFAIPMPFSRTFSRIAVNPESLLRTRTLGVAAVDTTLTVTYRYGGGLSHAAGADTIRSITTLRMTFPNAPSAVISAGVRGSIAASNVEEAKGGEDAPTVDELKSVISSMQNTQERIVTRPDLLARVYTIPSNFGRVFRAQVRSNANAPLATQLFIISRDQNGHLITSPDTLKLNLAKYLNPYRLISDAIDILDARVIDLSITFEVVVDPSVNRAIVLQNVTKALQAEFDIKNFYIDQPIVIDEIKNTIFGVSGIISINSLKFQNLVGPQGALVHSTETHDIPSFTKKGVIFPPAGGIFHVRYPNNDILGRAV